MIPNKPLQMQSILIFLTLSSAITNKTGGKNKTQNPQKYQKTAHLTSNNENAYFPLRIFVKLRTIIKLTGNEENQISKP